MEPQTKKKSPIIGVIAAAVGAVIGASLVGQYFNRPPNIDTALVKTSSEINKGLPMMVDKETRLDNTMTAPGKTIIYHYTLVNIKAADIQKDTLVKALRPQIVQSYKTNPGMKAFRDQGVTMRYDYSDEGGTFIAEIDVSPKDF